MKDLPGTSLKETVQIEKLIVCGNTNRLKSSLNHLVLLISSTIGKRISDRLFKLTSRSNGWPPSFLSSFDNFPRQHLVKALVAEFLENLV